MLERPSVRLHIISASPGTSSPLAVLDVAMMIRSATTPFDSLPRITSFEVHDSFRPGFITRTTKFFLRMYNLNGGFHVEDNGVMTLVKEARRVEMVIGENISKLRQGDTMNA